MSDILLNIKITVHIEKRKSANYHEFTLDDYDTVTDLLEALAAWVRNILSAR